MNKTEYKEAIADCKKKLNICSDSDENTEQIKALYLSLFEIYKKTGITMAEFETLIKQL